MILTFVIGFTYSEYRHRDEGTNVVEFFIDGAGDVFDYVAHFFDDEADKADDEVADVDDEADKADDEVADVDGEADKTDDEVDITDSKTDITNNERDYNLNLDTSIFTDIANTVKPKSPVTTFVEPTSYKPMITYEDINFPSEPKTVEDFEKVFLYMVNQGVLDLEIKYATAQDDAIILDNLNKGFDNVTETYIELFANIRQSSNEILSNTFSSSLTIKLSNNEIDDITLLSQEQYFQKHAAQINDALHEKNFITDDMTQREIAKELFRYVTRTLKYDTTFSQESYSGYGAIKNKTAVCQGYTALYNYLLKLNGIECVGQKGTMLENDGGHVWTVAILDGEKSYIDVTFGDPIPDREGYSNYEYFDVSKEFLSKDRIGVE